MMTSIRINMKYGCLKTNKLFGLELIKISRVWFMAMKTSETHTILMANVMYLEAK